jgi:hypothetical protein
MSLSLSPNSLYRQTTDCTEGKIYMCLTKYSFHIIVGTRRSIWDYFPSSIKFCRWGCSVRLGSSCTYHVSTLHHMPLSFCNQFLSPLMLWVRISIRARCTTLCYKVLLVTCDRSVVFSGSSGFNVKCGKFWNLTWPTFYGSWPWVSYFKWFAEGQCGAQHYAIKFY